MENQEAEQAARQRIIDYKKTFESEHGKEVLRDLINQFHIFNPMPTDMTKLAYMEGQRSVVLSIIHKTKINLDDFDRLLKGDL